MKTSSPIRDTSAQMPLPSGTRQGHGIWKWGSLGEGGFQQIPDALMRHQGTLDLTPTDLVVLLNVTMHWWTVDALPFPGVNMVARRMGTSRRTVERSLLRLDRLGLVKRTALELRADGSTFRRFDLSGLVARLEKLTATDSQHIARREIVRRRKETAAANSKLAAGR